MFPDLIPNPVTLERKMGTADNTDSTDKEPYARLFPLPSLGEPNG